MSNINKVPTYIVLFTRLVEKVIHISNTNLIPALTVTVM